MNKYILLGFGFWITIVSFVARAEVVLDGLTPHQTIELATDSLMSKFEAVKPLYQTDKDRYYAEIDAALDPFVGYAKIARGVMARYYRTANATQKKQFTQVFRDALVRLYAKSLIEFESKSLDVLPDIIPQKRPGRAKVNMNFVTDNDNTYPMSYSMYQDKQTGHWQVSNVILNGVNLGINFRTQFARIAKEKKGDIDAVIASWANSTNAALNDAVEDREKRKTAKDDEDEDGDESEE